jgi:hypothetical protein
LTDGRKRKVKGKMKVKNVKKINKEQTLRQKGYWVNTGYYF